MSPFSVDSTTELSNGRQVVFHPLPGLPVNRIESIENSVEKALKSLERVSKLVKAFLYLGHWILGLIQHTS
jgi:hypothetical protein